MTDKPKIIIDVQGGIVQEVYTPKGLECEIEIRDWDNGRECSDCGGFADYDDCYVKTVPHPDYASGVMDEYFLCAACAARRGITERHISITRVDLLREAAHAFLNPSEAKYALNDVVRKLKEDEATRMNCLEDEQLKYILECGIKPDELRGLLAEYTVPF